MLRQSVNFILRCMRAVKRRSKYIFALKGIRSILLFFIERRYAIQSRDELIDRLEKIIANPSNNLTQISASDKNEILTLSSQIICDIHTLYGTTFHTSKHNRWNVDYVTNYIWPVGKKFYKYRIIDYSTKSDVKYAWDASRSHDLLLLGEAYLLTKDEKYALKIKYEIDSFIDNNPFLRSINWTCAMDVAIRAVNWLYAVYMIRSSSCIDDSFIQRLSTSLGCHIFFIETFIEKGIPYSGNHYLADIAGLLYLYSFYGIKGKKYKSVLNEYFNEVRIQILSSGIHYEHSTSYHRLVTELVLYPFILLKRLGVYVPDDINRRIVSMTHFLDDLILPDGSIPLIGDNDNGRFLPFKSSDMYDYRYLPTISAMYFKNEKYRNITDKIPVDSYFLLDSLQMPTKRNVQLQSVFYEDSNFGILRNKRIIAFIHNMPFSRITKDVGNIEYSTHTHFDLLSYTLNIDGVDFIIDPGSYCYTSSPCDRLLFRSTKMHNTVSVDNMDQQGTNIKNLFSAIQYSFPSETKFSIDKFEGEYFYKKGVEVEYTHRRSLSLKDMQIIIKDTVSKKHNKMIYSYIHLGKNVQAYKSCADTILIERENKKIEMKISSDSLKDVRIVEGYISPEYGVKFKSIVIEIEYDKDIAIHNSTIEISLL